jgi:hypothetical protein
MIAAFAVKLLITRMLKTKYFIKYTYMRIPFDLSSSSFEEEARIKFLFTSPELHQNIEVSIDGNKISVELLLETFERFMGALGVMIPDGVVLGFVRVDEEGNQIDDEEESHITFELEDDDDDDDDKNDGDSRSKRKKK